MPLPRDPRALPNGRTLSRSRDPGGQAPSLHTPSPPRPRPPSAPPLPPSPLSVGISRRGRDVTRLSRVLSPLTSRFADVTGRRSVPGAASRSRSRRASRPAPRMRGPSGGEVRPPRPAPPPPRCRCGCPWRPSARPRCGSSCRRLGRASRRRGATGGSCSSGCGGCTRRGSRWGSGTGLPRALRSCPGRSGLSPARAVPARCPVGWPAPGTLLGPRRALAAPLPRPGVRPWFLSAGTAGMGLRCGEGGGRGAPSDRA